MKVLLVGSGITSAITGMCLRKVLPDCKLIVWDKARGTGGRMTTSRCPLDANCTADLGAQYFSTTEEFIHSNSDIYASLFSENVLEPLKCTIIGNNPKSNQQNFVAPNGSGILVKHFFGKAQPNETKFSHHVSSINDEGGMWIVETKTGEKEAFDMVILTMPVPQLFLLEGTIHNLLQSDIGKPLGTVTYSSRFVLVLFFLDNLKEDWGARYLQNDPMFRYVAIDNVKRNRSCDLCAVVFHTTVDFGQSYIEESLPNMEKILLAQAKLLFPNWPEPKSVKCHKWRYSQVTNTYPGNPGCVAISTSPPLLIGGDAFIGSTFDNCIYSSKKICENIKKILQLS